MHSSETLSLLVKQAGSYLRSRRLSFDRGGGLNLIELIMEGMVRSKRTDLPNLRELELATDVWTRSNVDCEAAVRLCLSCAEVGVLLKLSIQDW